ncbi:MAG: tetratricopeptide repeat protein [Desulfatiglandales bacterium]
MGLWGFLGGKTPREIEKRGDDYCGIKEYGAAMLEYEKAVDKFSKKSTAKPGDIERLKEKLAQSRASLACSHKETAEDLMETGHWDEAEERLILALELTKDEGLRGQIEGLRKEIQAHISDEEKIAYQDVYLEERISRDTEEGPQEEEYFAALCSAFPDEERSAYYSYGENFRKGFAALNRGDFDGALEALTRALEDDPLEGSFIPLELATVHLNLGMHEKAQALLEGFLKDHPASLRAYQVMCELLWERKEFDQALSFLDACPEELNETLAVLLLRAETLCQAERYKEAESFLNGYLKTFGWEENVGRTLARVFEAVDQKERARDLYGKIMEDCQTCRRASDPAVKRKYADLSFDTGRYSMRILELYLALVQEDPDNRAHYYQRISRIYSSTGNEKEAGRFLAFAKGSMRNSQGQGLED